MINKIEKLKDVIINEKSLVYVNEVKEKCENI